MSYRSDASLIISVELSLILDFPGIVSATIGGPAILRGYRGSSGNQNFTLASLLVTVEA
jgi:hypothetical protein